MSVLAVVLGPGTAAARETGGEHPPIVYQGCVAGECGLFVREPSGEHRRLTSDRSDQPETWSPDGCEIAYVKTVSDGVDRQYGLFVIGADGSDQRQISDVVLRDPSWSPDGGWIAFVRSEGGTGEPSELAVMSPDGSQARTVTTGVESFSWGPDGERLAAVTAGTRDQPGTLRVVGVDGQVHRTLPLAEPWPAGQPAWSPDGTTIAYGVTDGNKFAPGHTYLVPVDGTGARRRVSGRPDAGSWSPDGTRLALERSYLASTNVVAGEVDVVDARDGAVLTRLAQTDRPLGERRRFHDPMWSPQGRDLYVKTVRIDAEPGTWLTAIDAQGRNPTHLIAGGHDYVVGPPDRSLGGVLSGDPCGADRPAAAARSEPGLRLGCYLRLPARGCNIRAPRAGAETGCPRAASGATGVDADARGTVAAASRCQAPGVHRAKRRSPAATSSPASTSST